MKKMKDEMKWNDADSIVFKESIKVNDELKLVIKSISDVYKEFKKQGLSSSEAIALMKVMFAMKGESK